MMGDFNDVLNLEDRLGSDVTLEEVANFRQCVRDSGLIEMGVHGPFFHMDKQAGGKQQGFLED